jgi:predicted nucleic acid-binding protein
MNWTRNWTTLISQHDIIGILILAKRQGLLQAIKPSLDAIYHSYIYISEELYQHVLEVVNER